MSASAVVTAYEAHDWQGVVDGLEEVEALSADELVFKGDALYWLGEFDESVAVLEQAYKALVDEGRMPEAARTACLLGYLGARRQAFAVASGWLARAEHLLEDQPPSIGHMWLTLMQMGFALFAEGDAEAALRLGDEAIRLSEGVGSKSGQSFAMSTKAIVMANAGQLRDAMGLLDEATVMAMTVGEDLRLTSDVYCNTISLCRNLGDYKRAGEWTEQAERWMKANSVTAYTGACAVHRAELKRLHGSWQEAEDEARRACVGLEKFHLADYVGLARYEIGEIRRRMGDLEGAQRSFEEAYENGHDAQPGLSLLMMDRGEIAGAYSSIASAMDQNVRDPDDPRLGGPSRARLIPAFVEIALAAGEEAAAEAAIADLHEIAEIYGSEVWRAAADSSRGALLMAAGDAAGAIEALVPAWRRWQEVDLPYEMGRARAMMGEARLATGDERGGGLELKAALSTFEKLGAKTAAREVQRLLGQEGRGAPDTSVRTFMFTDIVTSTDLLELIGNERWHDLLQWHDRTLRAAISSAGGEEVSQTGDGFFAAFADARAAVECAVGIQRGLVDHRHETGFAPMVRIGLHTAEANRHGGDYSGTGVHQAARVGAIGGAEEIVISAAVVDAAGKLPYPLGESESVDLKGVTQPMDVFHIDWR